MAIKDLLDDLQNRLSIAQAGLKGALTSLKKTQSQTKKLIAGTRTPKKMASPVIDRKPKTKRKTRVDARGEMTKPKAKPKPKRRVRNPTDLVIRARAAVPRKPSKQKPARKSKSKYWP
jgi:hypothetical protein